MNSKVFIALVGATSILFAAGAVVAKGPDQDRQARFEAIDADGDGKITRVEIAAMGAARIARADTDGDGYLSLGEIEARGLDRVKERSARMMDRFDANDDDKLSADELADGSRADRRFNRADTDGDGALTKAEFDAARSHGKERRHAD